MAGVGGRRCAPVRAGGARPVQPAGEGSDEPDESRPPLLFVPGFGHGAWAFAEHWLEHAADAGLPGVRDEPARARRQRPGAGATLRAYAHDVVQVAAGLPRQAVLVGHGAGALGGRARAGPLPGPGGGAGRAGLRRLGDARRGAARNPFGTLPALFGGPPAAAAGASCSAASCPTAQARAYAARLGRAAPRGPSGSCSPAATRSRRWATRRCWCVGSPDDRVVPASALDRAARRYGGAPLLFPGMGHDLMLDARWREPIDAILDWLDKDSAPSGERRRACTRRSLQSGID